MGSITEWNNDSRFLHRLFLCMMLMSTGQLWCFLLRESYYKCNASSSAGAVNHFYVYYELSHRSELVQGFGAATKVEYDFVVVKSVYICSDCTDCL
jgi:hypothetical protein